VKKVQSISVIPIGFESLGVRSMCTFVETPDVRMLIDAGVALGQRFGKKPHPREYQARALCRSKIREYALKSQVIFVSHYHNDHHTPNYTETVWLGSSAEEAEQIYRDKTVIMKSFRDSINFSQRKRGWMFQRFLKGIGSKCAVGDGIKFEFGNTIVKVSKPVPHGERASGLGWVIMTTIEWEQEKIMHASDVQGPMSKQTTNTILKEKPDLLVLGGPPFYLDKVKVDTKAIQEGIANASRIARSVPTVIFEHHALRSENWREEIRPICDAGRGVGHTVITAAEYLGLKPNALESMRQQLYADDPPPESFLKWCALERDKQKHIPPPI
jgi:predicted metallo-beta-lactamase superfamily hydrolase